MVQISEQSNSCNHTPTTGNPTDDDIAVIGFSFKLPQDVDDVASFWDVLHHRRNLMTRWPESRMNAESFVAGKRSKFNCHCGYFIRDDPAAFMPHFLHLCKRSGRPRFHAKMDARDVRAFENAGIPAEKLKAREQPYSPRLSQMIVKDGFIRSRKWRADSRHWHCVVAHPESHSWYFDLRGPSIHIDTACSSSLFAVDMTFQSLRAGECSSALVTGSSLILTPTFTHYLLNLGFLSPDSKCWAFDHRANGYARGEGFIALLLKPLSAALRDGDMIRSVIPATGSNQDGQTPSLTQPRSRAQEELIRHVYEKANLPFDKTRYVEAHGTGTPVSNPIELKAIGTVFRDSRSANEPLYVGSVKTNIGHLEGASGLAGIVKSIRHYPASCAFEKVNPDIDIEFHNISIPTEEIVWPSEGLRRISVNSFGFGGTNIHVILDDAYHYLHERGLTGNHCTRTTWPATRPNSTNSPTHWPPGEAACSGAHSLSLSAAKPVRSSGEAGLAFVFTGQGAQYADMGWDLIHQYPLFAESLERIGEIYSSLGCEWDLLDELRNSENIDRPEYSQPLCTAVQVALVELLKSFNVVPKAAVGHSSGEIAAAYAMGALSLESACKVSCFRGQLAGKLRAADSGAMISLNLAEDEVLAYLEKIGTAAAGVSVACINSPLNCTLSGPECAIEALKEQAQRDQIFAQKLKTGIAKVGFIDILELILHASSSPQNRKRVAAGVR
ncbi:thiolase-like protein [Diplogelasinospora grovesii]|uniref:Thiolase-like protein n=1 Tax=Diplogelasinospora grovesii TaxID=303347 RepID=A0AAN6RYD3_9PEZI|nr:thiolase-like protein [Diplogelasinospora grovesii]